MKLVIALASCFLVASCRQSSEPQQATVEQTQAITESVQGSESSKGLLVLVPPSLSRDESETGLEVDATHYSFSEARDNMVLSLIGGLEATSREESETEIAPRTPAATIRGVPIYVTENEGVKTATWIEQGTAFAVDLECSSEADERCRSSDYIVSVVRDLVERRGPQ